MSIGSGAAGVWPPFSPDRFDVYYGMADNRIGVARLDVPDFLPPGGIANPPEAKV
jgi:hypothetical protein